MKLLITTLAALSLVALLPSCGSLQSLNVSPSATVNPKIQVEVSPSVGILGHAPCAKQVVHGTVKSVYSLDGLNWVDVKCGDKVVKTIHKKPCTCCKVGDKVSIQGTKLEVSHNGKTHLYVENSVVL